jgi:hypothetical protein
MAHGQTLCGVLALVCLGGIFREDLRHRNVHTAWLGGLWVCLAAGSLFRHSLTEVAGNMGLNLLFLGVLLSLLHLYFRVRERRWFWLFNRYLGVGDVVFWGVSSVYFSLPSFVLFFLLSLSLALALYAWLTAVRQPAGSVPLAGFQAVGLAGLLIWQWWYPEADMHDELYLIRFLP